MIKILCIGKMKDKALQALSSEYVRRISAFTRVEIIEVKDESNAHAEREAEASRIKDSEAERALGRLRDPDLVVLLDLDGRMWDSEGFACRLKDWQLCHRRFPRPRNRPEKKGGSAVETV